MASRAADSGLRGPSQGALGHARKIGGPAGEAGDIALKGGRPDPHVHAVLARRDGSTIGGHLVRGVVGPTLELMLGTGGALVRRHDPVSGLALIDPTGS